MQPNAGASVAVAHIRLGLINPSRLFSTTVFVVTVIEPPCRSTFEALHELALHGGDVRGAEGDEQRV